MKYTHTNIISKDWKKLADFYINTFECTIIPPLRNQSGEWLSNGTGVENAHLQGAHLLLPGHGEDGPTLEIYQYTNVQDLPALDPNTRGIGHLAFEVDDVEAVLSKLIKHGGSSNGSITSRAVPEVGIITFVYARDPDGNLIELQNWKR